jgi:hypothetical protein
MNDEDFARQAFATAFAAGSSKEPMTLPDAEALAFRGRRAARNRRGIYAAGTTALAGVVTAGVAGGPSLLNLGAGSGATGVAAAGGSSVSPVSPVPPKSPSQSPDAVKPSGVPCATPPTIDWAGIVAAALPAGIHAVPDNAVNCLDFPEGSRSIEAGFTLSVPGSILQISVEKGGALATKLGQTSKPLESKSAPPAASGSGSADSSSASSALDPSALASLQALKHSMVDPSTLASLDAMKQSIAAKDDAAARAAKERLAAAAAASLASDGTNPDHKTVQPSCHQVAPNISVCASTVTKGGYVGTDVQLIRSGADPVVIDVVAASGTDAPSPAPGTKAPLDDVQVTAIAQAVLTHF